MLSVSSSPPMRRASALASPVLAQPKDELHPHRGRDLRPQVRPRDDDGRLHAQGEGQRQGDHLVRLAAGGSPPSRTDVGLRARSSSIAATPCSRSSTAASRSSPSPKCSKTCTGPCGSSRPTPRSTTSTRTSSASRAARPAGTSRSCRATRRSPGTRTRPTRSSGSRRRSRRSRASSRRPTSSTTARRATSRSAAAR